MSRTVVFVVAVMFVAVVNAAKVDPRLATVRKAFIVAKDDLGDDRLVANCLTERLHMITPVEVATLRADADAIFIVKANIPGAARRYALG
ncbi:MAG: hypothetical protein ABJA98_26280 [Acidobacteriota bacterium]